MPNRIRVLDIKTINQIAAGEVVERPVSVVKELVENSIDAHSTIVVIELLSAGRKLIRVTDNGDGIVPEDLKLAFQKHSTSKISNINDIYNLSTLGFRGEALASIGAVARVECISCDGKNLPGKKIILEGGVVKKLEEIGCSKGTTLKVKDLFYNLPARYKYLKSNQTELAHIIDVITHLAIYHYRIGFKLIHNGNELLNFPAVKNQLDNLVNIYGREIVRNLIPISCRDSGINESESDDRKSDEPSQGLAAIHISGYIGKPSITRSDNSYQSIFLNGRYIENKIIKNAIKDAYRTLVMKNRYPFAVLFIEMAPSAIDVNISPTKLHVRFENEESVYNKVYMALQNALRSHELIPELTEASKPQPVSLKAITTFGVGKPGIVSTLPTTAKKDDEHHLVPGGRVCASIARQSIFKTGTQAIGGMVTKGNSHVEPYIKDQKSINSDVSSQPGQLNQALPYIQPIGQIFDTYIIAEAGNNILIIDQHAAHERIMYEKIKQRFSSMSMSTQSLLEPVALEFSPKELELLRSSLDTLRELNFEIDEMGKDSYYVKGIPIILGRMLEPEYIHDMINDLIKIRKEKEHDIIKDKMIQTMACKAAIKAGKPLNIPEIQQLLRELYSIENPFTCAHGRPTIITLTDTQLQKLFKRIV